MSRTLAFCIKSLLLITSFVLFGCHPALKKEAERPEQALYPVHFFYPKFKDDMDFSSLTEAINRNMGYLNRLDPQYVFDYGSHKYTCRQVIESQEAFLDILSKNPDPKELNKQIKEKFSIYRAAGRAGDRHVLFTGYFEPIYEGSLTPGEEYPYPLYGEPDDLVRIDLSLFREEFKGKQIIAKIEGKSVSPYFSREEIEKDKALKGRGLEIVWLKDPVDVAFLHIQGSGRIRLPDGTTIFVGYQVSNGRPYRSIGAYMIDEGYVSREDMSMQGIRQFLSTHPEVVEEVLNHNPSYIFFRTLDDGPYGNINVILTPGRSLALDSRLFPKGALCFISTEKPVVDGDGEITEWVDFSRFVLNQDTGGAIRGAGRADIFWGNDDYAQLAAGHLKHEGELFILIKKPEE